MRGSLKWPSVISVFLGGNSCHKRSEGKSEKVGVSGTHGIFCQAVTGIRVISADNRGLLHALYFTFFFF